VALTSLLPARQFHPKRDWLSIIGWIAPRPADRYPGVALKNALQSQDRKGKPGERRGRKALGLTGGSPLGFSRMAATLPKPLEAVCESKRPRP